MIVTLITLAATIVPGLIAWYIALRWPRADLMAPAASYGTIAKESRRHRRFVTYLNSHFSPQSSTAVALAVTMALVVIAAAGVGALLVMIHTHTGLAKWDRAASIFAAAHATSLSDQVLRQLTQFGGALWVVPLAVIVAVVETIRQRSSAVVIFLTLVVGCQFLVANITKALVDRTRPAFDQLTGFSGPSFPSGHAVASAACFAAFALVIGRGRTLSAKALLGGLAVGMATGISCSRVFLGVHWLTDVLGGLLIGWVWFAMCSVAFGGRQLKFGTSATLAREVIPPSPKE
jgi:undecaprenyl-diphosphatase